MKTLKMLKQQTNCFYLGRWVVKPIFLQDEDAKPHTSAATSAAIENTGIKVLPNPPFTPDLTPSDFLIIASLNQ